MTKRARAAIFLTISGLLNGFLSFFGIFGLGWSGADPNQPVSFLLFLLPALSLPTFDTYLLSRRAAPFRFVAALCRRVRRCVCDELAELLKTGMHHNEPRCHHNRHARTAPYMDSVSGGDLYAVGCTEKELCRGVLNALKSSASSNSHPVPSMCIEESNVSWRPTDHDY